MRSPSFPFTHEPFSRELAAAQIFISKGHQEVLARLRHAIESGSLAVITGHVGSGKSTAICSVMNTVDISRYRFVYLASSAMTAAEFYRSLLDQVNVQPRRGMGENKRLVNQTMLEWGQKGIKSVVVIDEAHELAVSMLSELRFVLNYQVDSFSPLTVILVGQPQLTDTLRLQVLECIRQRISVHYQLPCLAEEEASAYILHHLTIAGLNRQVFTEDAIATIYQFSKGIPRRINNLCRYALVAAIGADCTTVDVEAVQKGLSEALL